MGVAGDVIAAETEQPFQALADDGAAQMADVHGLGHVRAAEVDDDLARIGDDRRARVIGVRRHFLGAFG